MQSQYSKFPVLAFHINCLALVFSKKRLARIVFLILMFIMPALFCTPQIGFSENTPSSAPITQFKLTTTDIRKHFQDVTPSFEETTLETLSAAIDLTVKKLSLETKVHEFSIYAKDLKSYAVYSWQADRLAASKTFGHEEAYYKGASVAKLYEVFAVYRLAEAGFIDLDQPLKDPYTGVRFTLREAVSKAIRKSDNDSFCRILRAVGPGNINAVLMAYGIKDNYIYAELGPARGFSIPNNITRYKTTKSSRVNPYGAGLILEMVYREAATGNPYMKAFKEHLLNNVYTSRIPAALRYAVPVAHKTGTIESEGVYHDAGIVYGKSPYIVVIFTKDAPNDKAAHTFIRGAVQAIGKTFSLKRSAMDQALVEKTKHLSLNQESEPSDETLDITTLPNEEESALPQEPTESYPVGPLL